MGLGDHLVVDHGWYQHHGIDVGDGEIVHFGRGLHDIANACVELVSREQFSSGRPIRVLAGEAEFPGDEVARRARSRLGEAGYDLFENNCEHFARWCRSGSPVSWQADVPESLVRQGIAAATRSQVRSRLLKRAISGRLSRAVTRVGPAAWVADGVQLAAEWTAQRRGLPTREARQWGAGAGAATAACCGAMTAGVPGGIAGVAIWAAGQVVGTAALETGKRAFRKHWSG